MATDPEARAQLARLLGDDRLRSATAEAVSEAAESRLALLADGLLAEATASDDVIDGSSALDFIEARLQFFGPLLGEDQQARLREALRAKIEAW